MAALEYQRIYNALVAAAMAGEFHPVSVDTVTKLATVSGNAVAPATALANEKTADFGPAERKTTYTDDRTGWEWELILEFNSWVSCEAFEIALTQTPLRIARDNNTGNRQITLRLTSAEYDHPLQQQPSTGTRAVFKFEASLSPL